jgi:Cu/Ag efflux protein CusF
MKAIYLPAMFAASLLLATASFAAAQTTSGIIKSIDAKNDSITLVGGKSFILGNEMEAETFKVGENIVIKFTMVNGKMTASSVKAKN